MNMFATKHCSSIPSIVISFIFQRRRNKLQITKIPTLSVGLSGKRTFSSVLSKNAVHGPNEPSEMVGRDIEETLDG